MEISMKVTPERLCVMVVHEERYHMDIWKRKEPFIYERMDCEMTEEFEEFMNGLRFETYAAIKDIVMRGKQIMELVEEGREGK